MANKSVTAEMILKARDEFSATYKQFEEVLKKSASANENLNKTFGSTAEGAERARDALNDIGKADKGIDKIARTLESLIKKTTGLKTLEDTAVTLAQKIKEVSQSIDEARSQQGDPAIAKDFEALTAAAIKTRQAIKDTAQQLEQMQAAARDKALAGNRADLEKAVADQAKLTAAYEKQRATLQTLIASERERINSAVAKADAGVEAATQKYAEQARRVEQLAQAKGKDGEMTATQARQLAAAQGRLTGYGEAVDKAKAALAGAQREQQAFSSSVVASDKVRKAAENLRNLAQQARAAGEGVKVAAAGLNTVTIPPATQARMDKLASTIKALEQDYNTLTAQADRAGAALRDSLGPPPKGLQQELNKLNGQMAATQARIKAATGSINQMQTELNEAGVDTTDLAAAQQRLAGTAGQLATRKKELAGAIQQANTAQRQGNDEARAALNATQRLRGNVLALISAYVGLYGIARQVGQVFSAASREETIRLRFDAAFDGDAQKVAQAMEFVRAESDRLKVSFLGSGEEFSQFVASLPRGKYELEEITRVFTGFTTAGVALGLSNERMKRVFLAITQMASKGTVSMEELKQQLGESLPGALNLFAEAAGYSSDRLGEFLKLVESGGVRSDILFKVADLMIERYGKQVPEALKKPAAALRAFQLQVELVQLELAKSGFINTLTEELGKLTEVLQDPATKQDLKAFAAAIGQVIRLLVAAAPHLKEILLLFGAYQGLKVAATITTIATGFKSANGGVVQLNRTLPSLIANLKKLSAAQVLVGGPVVAGASLVGGWGLMQLYELIAASREATSENDRHKKAVAELRLEYEKFAKKAGEAGAQIREKTLPELQAMKKEISAAISDLHKENVRMIQASTMGISRFLAQTMATTVGLDIDLRLFKEEDFEALNQRLTETQARLEDINAEIARRPESKELSLPENVELQNAADNVKAYTQALMDLESADIDSNIRRINEAFAAQRQGMEEAGQGMDAYLVHERERVNTVVALEEYRRDRIIEIANQEADARLQLLAEQEGSEEDLAKEQRKIIADLANFRTTVNKSAWSAINKLLDESLGAEKDYAKEVKRIRKTLALEIANQGEEGFQSAMGGQSPWLAYQALQERRIALAKTTAATEKALEEGNYQLAEELARKRKELAQSIADAQITSAKTGAVLVSEGESRLQADNEIRIANEQIKKAIEGQEAAAIAAGKAQAEITKEIGKSVEAAAQAEKNSQGDEIRLNASMDTDNLKIEILKIQSELEKDPLSLALKLNDKTAMLQLAELKKPTESVHTVKLVVDSSALPKNIPGLAGGGPIPGFAGGGRIRGPGTGTSDSILMRGANGEWVIRADAVRFWGDDFMRSINNRQLPPMPSFAGGGPVGRLEDFSSTANDEPRGEVVTHRFEVGGKSIGELTGERDVVDSLINALRGLK
ncbi:MAG: hypothetical protein VR73_14750 [Gammaproteobacteria bacterium BRH_c0]|nr:MAG: hypothetical protein VR73_14750 [Gammaproteobacteria bacterium BRH_c0]